MRSLRDRWEAKVQKSDECWLWTGWVTPNGYGQIREGSRNARVLYAHRVAYELFMGPVPEGLQLDHLCRVRHCVNPFHLEAVTTRENTLRGTGPAAKCARVTHCPQGHPYDEENTHVDRRGKRVCRACQPLHRKRRKARLADTTYRESA